MAAVLSLTRDKGQRVCEKAAQEKSVAPHPLEQDTAYSQYGHRNSQMRQQFRFCRCLQQMQKPRGLPEGHSGEWVVAENAHSSENASA